ncbi:outer membrane protein assembly factor BamA [Lujinxingia sediminis]|nr:outer membrane protein assembly factor BamA [Lujinxingia sediminis]
MVDGKLRAALLLGALVGLIGMPTALHAQGMPQLERPEILDSAPVAPRLSAQLPSGEAAAEGQDIAEVRVQGNRRVEAASILDRVRLRAGMALSREQVSEDIRRIFALGYFDDVRVDATATGEGVVVTFIVDEKPAIDAIRYRGNDALSTEDIEEVVELQRFSIANFADINRSATAIQELYREKGHYLAEVDYEIDGVEGRDDLAVVTFEIREYSKVRVKRVTLLGNSAIEDDELKNIMATREGHWLSFLTKFGNFREQDFQDDLTRLVVYYYHQGYLQVQIDEPTIRLSRDKRDLYLTIRIDEGIKHYLNEVTIQGDLLADEDQLRAMIDLEPGDVMLWGEMLTGIQRIQRFYQDAGYANARVVPQPIPTQEDPSKVNLALTVTQGPLVSIGRIEVVGNVKTRDKVVRRELVIEEGQLYSASAIEQSRARVERLGYFEQVTVTSQPTSSPDVVDLRIEIKERPTGTFQIGAGLSSQESFIFQGQVSQENLLGRGQSLALSIQASGIRRLFNLRFSEPWLLGTRWQFAVDLYNFDYLYQDFSRVSTGGNLTFGYPLGELLGLEIGDALSTSLTYKLEDVQVKPGGYSGTNVQPASPLFTGGLTSSVRLGAYLDTRDNRIFPKRGMYHSARVEVADGTLTASENEFIKYDLDARFYFPLFWNMVLRLNGNLGFVTSTSPDRPVPIFERYFAGGPDTIRGFDRYTLGPSRRVPGSSDDPSGGLSEFHYGGNKRLVLTAEVEFPIIAAGNVTGVVFTDVGNAFDDGTPFTLKLDLMSDDANRYADALRTTVGFGVRWFSPIGPLRFEWGVPLERLSGEKPLVFDFSIQNAF